MTKHAGRARKRIQAIAFAVVFGVLAPMAIVIWLSRGAQQPPQPMLVQAVGGIVLGVVCLLASGIVYAAATLTNCLTFDFRQPVWRGFRTRFVVAHLLVQTLLVVAIVFLTAGAAAVAGLLTGATFDSTLLGLLAAAPLTILILYGVNLWVPLNWSLFRRILTARGVRAAEIQTATFVGVSDPSRSSWRKGVIEEDIGALWLGQDDLIYRGDLRSLRVPRQDVVAIERDVDPGNVAAVTGAEHPVVVWRDGETVRRIRLHAEGHWLRHRSARELGRLAERLDRWRSGGAESS